MFSHAFQPIIDVHQRKVVSYEALLRGPNGEPPGHVFSQIQPQDMMLFDQASRETALSTACNLGVECSINLNFLPSSILFDEGALLRQTIQAATRLGLSAGRLVVEVTEGELVRGIGPLQAILNSFRREKIKVAIDDFGAGYSGLNMLAEVHPDIIKIDMQLVRHIHTHGARQAIVRAICGICQDLGIYIVAEGVETREEHDFLKSTGIACFQGYLYGKPAFESCLGARYPE